jgi:phosphoglycolate phosphatase
MSLNSTAVALPEILRSWPGLREISHIVFDFDGTLSWLRHGWPSIMFDLFYSFYPADSGENKNIIRHKLEGIILGMNGTPTIFQMIHFSKMLGAMGANCPDPEDLRIQYQERLDQAIARRTRKILTGEANPDQYLVFGVRSFLEELNLRGYLLFILSTTLEHRVREEADCLRISQYFGGNIIGGTGDPLKFSKMTVLKNILERENIRGSKILSIGDGPVEIGDTDKLGGLSIGVASDESHNGSGIPDPWKRQQLIDAGAHAIIPDFRNAKLLI